ncbi:nuclear transport factor 2 family protein [Belnapia sp. F-4-1]|uniref:nuclear transport factor 2 family protein n=1 Tax=Belnapia sp. F-4-1 TaxID=1545443 RepID=UPI0005BB81BD|nr:nuclear transport factor 2 family protein [Belnapia sp. F-4-1]
MPSSIATLLTRNLHDVFGEDDAGRRRTAIDELFTEDAVFYEPEGIHRGRDAIDRIAGVIRDAQPGLRYSPLRRPEEMHGAAGRIQWVAGRPGEAPAHAGTDVILVRDGRIAAIYLFFDPVPARAD